MFTASFEDEQTDEVIINNEYVLMLYIIVKKLGSALVALQMKVL